MTKIKTLLFGIAALLLVSLGAHGQGLEIYDGWLQGNLNAYDFSITNLEGISFSPGTSNGVPLSQLSSSGATNTQVLTYNGTTWAPSNAPSTGSGSGFPLASNANLAGFGLTNGFFVGNGAGLTNINPSAKIYDVMGNFGALGNGVLLNGTTGGLNSTTITNTLATFTTNDIGKYVHITGGGTNGADLFTTISSVSSSTVAVLANPVLVSGLSAPMVYGNDDSGPIQTAITYCSLRGATLFFPSNIYCIADQIIDPGIYTNHANAQLGLPFMPKPTGDFMPTFTMQGPRGSTIMEFSTSNKFSAYGATLWCMLPDGSGSGGLQGSMFSCLNNSTPCYVNRPAGSTNLYQFNGTRVCIQDLSFRIPSNPNMVGLDLRDCPSVDLSRVYVSVGADEYFEVRPTHQGSACIAMPGPQNSGQEYIHDCFLEGAYNGLVPNEHAVGDATIYNCSNAVCFWDGYGHVGQGDPALSFDIEGCVNGIATWTGAFVPMNIFFTAENNNVFGNVWSYPMQNAFVSLSGQTGIASGKIRYQFTGNTNFLGVTSYNPSILSISAAVDVIPEGNGGGPYVDQTPYTNNSSVSAPYYNAYSHHPTKGGFVNALLTNDLYPAQIYFQTQDNSNWWIFTKNQDQAGNSFTLAYSTNNGASSSTAVLSDPAFNAGTGRFALLHQLFTPNATMGYELLTNRDSQGYIERFDQQNDSNNISIHFATQNNSNFWVLQKLQDQNTGDLLIFGSTNNGGNNTTMLRLSLQNNTATIGGVITGNGGGLTNLNATNVFGNPTNAYLTNFMAHQFGTPSIAASIGSSLWISTGGSITFRMGNDFAGHYTVTNGASAGTVTAASTMFTLTPQYHFGTNVVCRIFGAGNNTAYGEGSTGNAINNTATCSNIVTGGFVTGFVATIQGAQTALSGNEVTGIEYTVTGGCGN